MTVYIYIQYLLGGKCVPNKWKCSVFSWEGKERKKKENSILRIPKFLFYDYAVAVKLWGYIYMYVYIFYMYLLGNLRILELLDSMINLSWRRIFLPVFFFFFSKYKSKIIFFKENYIHNITLLNLLKRNYTFFSPMINGCWAWHNLRKLLKTFLFVILFACFSRICMKFLFTLESC